MGHVVEVTVPIEVEMGMATSLGLSALGQTGAGSEGLPTGLLSKVGMGLSQTPSVAPRPCKELKGQLGSE